MNVLHLRLSDKDRTHSLEIENDADAKAAYDTLKSAMDSGVVTEFTMNGEIYAVRGSDIRAVGYTSSAVIAARQAEAQKAQAALHSAGGHAGVPANAAHVGPRGGII